MDIKNLISKVDHTLLTPTATKAQILAAADEAVKFGAASVCIPPCYVQAVKKHVGNQTKVCTVIGFPNGYAHSTVKLYEAERALADGADELDVVVNQSWVKDSDIRAITREIATIKHAAGRNIVKLIVETCQLSEHEKRSLCAVVLDSGADFIKTSTGFSTGGATTEDIILFRALLPNGFGIKAAGGIQTLDDAERFLNLGATRLGTSRIIKILQNQTSEGY